MREPIAKNYSFEDTGEQAGRDFEFGIPPKYANGANIVAIWTSKAIVGDVLFRFDYRAVGGDDVETLDQVSPQESVEVIDSAPSSPGKRMKAVLPLTDGNFQPGDTVKIRHIVDGADTRHTMAAVVEIRGLYFEYQI